MNTITPLKIVSLASVSLLIAACGNDGSADSQDTTMFEQMDYTITGIEPGSGITESARTTLEEYDNLDGWELQESSTGGMMVELDQAIQNEEPIIITGWQPHHIFEIYDLKILEDPQQSFGASENIHTMTRIGLEDDMPDATAILDNFAWEIEDMQQVVLEAQELPFEEAAQNWYDENLDLVNEWTDGVPESDGQSIDLISMPWDTERASAHVMTLVLENHGFDVNVTSVDPSILFQALAQGEADATVTPWLPTTHGAFMEEYGDDLVDLGPNLPGAVSGLVVPAYMDIDSIEDIPAND
ncbi:glycine betaine ABC transporter substrate-binding protein [Alkalibacterium sp. f15]|uniref:glycine betaine ABC transporter substrate-binding protein n=1 Tax=Alkalibacterium sp. f15 TaxID=3414029 RepID=UPI003BF809DC